MMKTSRLLLGCLGLLIFAVSCQSNSESSNNWYEEDEDEGKIVKVDVKVTDQMGQAMDQVMDAYYQVSEAFVEANAQEVKQALKKLKTQSSRLPIEDLSKKNQEQVHPALIDLKEQIDQMQQADSIEAMKRGFENISDMTYHLIQVTGLRKQTVYRSFCPMAFNDEGAYWLSNSSDIRNPYYGHKMINCGLVKETLEF